MAFGSAGFDSNAIQGLALYIDKHWKLLLELSPGKNFFRSNPNFDL